MSAESEHLAIYVSIRCPAHQHWPHTGEPVAGPYDAYLNCKTLEWHCPTCSGCGFISKCLRADFVPLLTGPKSEKK